MYDVYKLYFRITLMLNYQNDEVKKLDEHSVCLNIKYTIIINEKIEKI